MVFYTLPDSPCVYLQSSKEKHSLFGTTWEIPPTSKRFINNLHINWSSIKELTDTSALSGRLETKTTASEPRETSSLSPQCTHVILQDEGHHLLSRVTQIPATRQKTWHIQGKIVVACETAWSGQKVKSLEEEEKGAQPVASWKMNKWVAWTAWTRRKL